MFKSGKGHARLVIKEIIKNVNGHGDKLLAKFKLGVYKPKEHMVTKVEPLSQWVQDFLVVLVEFFI